MFHAVFWHGKSYWQHMQLISVVDAQERSTIAKKAEEEYQAQLMEVSGLFRVSRQC